jgi:hypothetical protein
MSLDIHMAALRNILLLSALITVTVSVTMPQLQQELLKLWKTLKTPKLPKKPASQKSDSFWEIDMTKFEP